MNKNSAYVSEEVRYISESTFLINLGYVCSVFGILKIIEFVLLIIAWSLVVNFQGYYSFPITIYYIVITSIGWAYILIEYNLYIFNHYKRLGSVWPYLLSLAAALITANGLLAYLARLLSDQNISPFFCNCIIVITSCNVIYAACVFGFLAAIVLLIDSYLHYREYQNCYIVHSHYARY